MKTSFELNPVTEGYVGIFLSIMLTSDMYLLPSVLASSGIDYDVKLWMPTSTEPGFDEEKAYEVRHLGYRNIGSRTFAYMNFRIIGY